MRTTRWGGVAAIAFASTACCLAWSAGADPASEEPLAFVTADRLRLPPLRLRLGPTEADLLAAAWLSQLGSGDARLAAGAIDLLQDAPKEVVEAAVKKLGESGVLERVLREARPEVQDRILNARAMNTAKLRDFAAASFIGQLDSALTSGDTASLAHLASLAGGFRHLPNEAITKIVAALERGTLSEQARRELIGVLLQHGEELGPAQTHLERWLGSPPGNAVAEQRRNFARVALLTLGAQLPAGEVVTALGANDPAANTAAIRYLRKAPEGAAMDAKLSAGVADVLFAAPRLPTWAEAHELLLVKNPKFLDELYANTAQTSLAKLWSPEIGAAWVSRAPVSQDANVAGFSLDLFDPPPEQLADCNVLRYKLAVLTRRARLAKTTLDDFWTALAIKLHNCRAPLSDAVDDYLAHTIKIRDPGPELAALVQKHGLGQLPEMQLRSTRLAQALSPELSRRLAASDWNLARQLLLTGVKPSPSDLEQIGFWTKMQPSASGLTHELYFRIVQAAGRAPSPVLQRAAEAAADQSLDAVSRSAALIALAAAGRTVEQQNVFLAALADTNQLVSRTALILLGQAYDKGLPKGAFKGPEHDLVALTLTRPDLANEATQWLARLVAHGPTYAQLYVEQAKWAEAASKSCFVLASAKPLGTAVGISMLDAAATATEGTTDVLRACTGMLFDPKDPVAIVTRQWNGTTSDRPVELLGALKDLWEQPSFKSASSMLNAAVAGLVASSSSGLPYRLESQKALSWWEDELYKQHPRAAAQLQFEWRKRAILGAAVAIPAVVLLHLAVWGVLLVGYPKSPTLQAVVFWNPLVRKVIGFGYIDLVLLYVPFARRRLFAPFASEFLRDVYSTADVALDRLGYFQDSRVHHRAARTGAVVHGDVPLLPITSALATHKGRVLLLGKSGLGKSSFLRFWLSHRAKEGKEAIVYLRADQCRGGVEAEIVRRMKSVGSDQALLRSVIYAGRLSVYVDGYNEVDLATQDAITAFVGDYPHGNILVTSQIPLRGFTGIETFELVPLDQEQIRSFLTSRVSVLAQDAVVRDATFVRSAGAFLDDTWTRPTSEEEARAFDEILANPMDLTSVALLLSQGGIPDLFALEKQQFDIVKRRLQAASLEFRTAGFSEALLKQRLSDQEDLGGLPFKPEVAELVHAKLAQVRTFTEPSGKVSTQEVRFRHDRIRDFFTHFSFLDMTSEEQAAHAKDARFAGVFPYLARSMSHAGAEELREQLITLAAHLEDHRVSDSFVREYSWRQRFASQDPDWMLSHDLPVARVAESRYTDLAQKHLVLEADMNRLRDEISGSRRITRILTTSDTTTMVQLARELLMAMGAQEALVALPIGTTLADPSGRQFLLIALTQKDGIRAFHVDLLLARIEPFDMPKLVVVNSQVATDPEGREPELSTEAVSALAQRRVAVLSGADLYEAYSAYCLGQRDGRVWSYLAHCWLASGSAVTSEGRAVA